jgi:hypothetical protein
MPRLKLQRRLPLQTLTRLPRTALIDAFAVGSVAFFRSAASPSNSAVREGSHDFDFIYGKWRMPNHRLKERLAGSHKVGQFQHLR